MQALEVDGKQSYPGRGTPKNPPPRDWCISEVEIEWILLALEYQEETATETQRQEIAVAFLLALETAMRQGELWSLRWEAVHLQERFLHLTETKNGTERDVPLSSRAVVLLKKLSPRAKGRVFAFNQKSSGTIFCRALVLAGLKGFDPLGAQIRCAGLGTDGGTP